MSPFIGRKGVAHFPHRVFISVHQRSSVVKNSGEPRPQGAQEAIALAKGASCQFAICQFAIGAICQRGKGEAAFSRAMVSSCSGNVGLPLKWTA